MRSSEGRPFQVEGPTTEKARICLVEVLAKGTRRRPCWDERSDRELIALRGGQPSSRHVGRQEQGQLSITRPRKRSCMKSAAQQEASGELSFLQGTYNLTYFHSKMTYSEVHPAQN